MSYNIYTNLFHGQTISSTIMSESKKTTDINTIKSWAEDRNGVPAVIKDTDKGGGDGVLRIHFPQNSSDQENFDEISWDQFKNKFEENNLAMVYQEQKDNGSDSTFYKFVAR